MESYKKGLKSSLTLELKQLKFLWRWIFRHQKHVCTLTVIKGKRHGDWRTNIGAIKKADLAKLVLA